MARALGAVCLALLGTCGGGGRHTALDEPTLLVSSAAATGLCGVQIPPTSGAPVHQVSANLPSMPLSDLPTQTINGFKFLNNFSTTQATAVVRMSKTALADPATARVCFIDRNAAATCSVPNVTDETDRWTFILAITAPGVYILWAPRDPLPLD